MRRVVAGCSVTNGGWNHCNCCEKCVLVVNISAKRSSIFSCCRLSRWKHQICAQGIGEKKREKKLEHLMFWEIFKEKDFKGKVRPKFCVTAVKIHEVLGTELSHPFLNYFWQNLDCLRVLRLFAGWNCSLKWKLAVKLNFFKISNASHWVCEQLWAMCEHCGVCLKKKFSLSKTESESSALEELAWRARVGRCSGGSAVEVLLENKPNTHTHKALLAL